MKRIIPIIQLITTAALIIIIAGCSPVRSNRQIPHFTEVNASSWQLDTSGSPQHIALLLPLTGDYANYANAIRKGFFSAYFDQKNRMDYSPSISVIDTTHKNIHEVYQSAVAQGANIIVGPLDKANVLALAQGPTTPTPILALNSTPDALHINNNALYEFALSPTDEAQQAAVKNWQDHHRNVIILAPNNAWGQRLSTAFSDEWKKLGGTIVATQYYGNMSSLSKNIADVLQITSGYQSDRALKNMLHEKIRYIPQRREDFDSIFLVSTEGMAQQIRPLLEFYFAGNIPIYSTSQIYSGRPNNDLNGIQFCDMPWIIAPNQMQPAYLNDIQQHIRTLWPNNYAQYAKFYAMGVDAFSLATQLSRMQSSGMPGATGTLYLTSQHYVYRQLMWAQIQNGVPQLVH